jgi:hypothetical protein
MVCTGTVRIPFVRIRINTTKKCIFLALKMIYIKTSVGDPDPLVRGTDPRIRIRTKMSRIPNTD